MWLRTMIGARWFPYVLIGAVSSALIVFGWGYMKGYNSAESSYQVAMNKALEEQYRQMAEQSQLERKLALASQRKKYEIRKNVSEVPTPSTGCDLSAECMLWYDNILRAANSNSE